MTNANYWAFVNTTNIVENVIVASQEWIDNWHLENPDSDLRTLPTSPDAKDYAGVGYSWDESLGRFVPPQPGPDCIYDVDDWAWHCPPPPED